MNEEGGEGGGDEEGCRRTEEGERDKKERKIHLLKDLSVYPLSSKGRSGGEEKRREENDGEENKSYLLLLSQDVG